MAWGAGRGESPGGRQELIGAARAIAGVLDATALESERARTLCPAAVEAFSSSGLWGLMAPREIGGHEADPVTQLLVIEEVCRADGSAGWCLAVGAASIAMGAAFLADDAVAAIFGTPGTIIAGQVVPRGRAEPVVGGFRVSGRWTFGSGCRHSTWLLGGCAVVRDGEGSGPPEARVAFLPRAQVEIIDTWHVAGLKGTGSCDYAAEPVFTPEGFTFDLMNPVARRGGALYRLPLTSLVAASHAGFALGLGRRALDEMVLFAAGARHSRGGVDPADRPALQQALARGEAALRSARLFAIDRLEDIWSTVCSGDVPSQEQRAMLRLAVSHATDVAAGITSTAYRLGGSRALFETNPLQRCFRDMHAATQHVVVADEHYERIGQLLLGSVPPGTFF